MSLQFVIDGYNLIHHPHIAAQIKKYTDPRFGLLQYIAGRRLCGSPKNKLTVVFDGWPPAGFSLGDTPAGVVLFSRDASADERIQQIVGGSSNPKVLVVVSDDRQVHTAARLSGATAMGIEDFLGLKEEKKRRREPAKQELDPRQARLINEELAKIWKIT